MSLLTLCVLSTFSLIWQCSAECTPQAVQPLVTAMFTSLGQDCQRYASLFTEDAVYYHQHDGFKVKSQLLQNCKNYAAFCPGQSCHFVQNAALVATMSVDGQCHILAPYLWSEVPVNNKVPGNLEPHTGWEYLVAVKDNTSARDSKQNLGYLIQWFAEVETSYSVAYNWANPLDTTVYNWTLALLATTASMGECTTPVHNVITAGVARLNAIYPSSYWRQQGAAVVLSVGGLCQAVVPVAGQLQSSQLITGHAVFVMQPLSGSYLVMRSLFFAD
jgi:hypothetical protein